MAYTLKGKLDSIAAGLSGIDSVAVDISTATSNMTASNSILASLVAAQSTNASIIASAASEIASVNTLVPGSGMPRQGTKTILPSSG